MDFPLYILREEPFVGFFPQDLLQWLKTEITDDQLAEAYTIVHNHCSTIMMFSTDNDPWEDQAFYDWWDVEDEIIAIITKRMKETGISFPEGRGTHYLVAPFMEAHGYRDSYGTWHKKTNFTA